MLAAFVTFSLVGMAPAHAQVKLTVNSSGDAGDISPRNGICETSPGNGICTLRAAIQESNAQAGADSISFRIPTTDPNYNATTGVYTIPLLTALPAIGDSVQINGPGADRLTITRSANATGFFRFFDVTSTGTVGFSGVTISLGFDTTTFGGGAIRSTGAATLNINNCVLMGNIGYGGGGIFFANGTLNVTNSTFRQNVTTGAGERSGGGIFNYYGRVNITNSTFYQNHSTGYGGAVYNLYGVVNVTGSVFYENGTSYFGGALGNLDGTLTVSNSTLFGNIAYAPGSFGASGWGGAIGNDGDGIVNVGNSTVTANYSGGRGGGFYNQGGAFTVKSSIVAENRGSIVAGGIDVAGPFVSQGFNLIGKKDGSTGFTLSTDKKGTVAAPVNPRFDAKGLRNNGGPTLIVALTSGSPAVDKGTSLGITGVLATDQRGSGFLRKVDKAATNATGGDGTDIGAYELQ
jgi:hypothetical protein